MVLLSTLPMISEVNVNTLHEIGFTIGYVFIAAMGAYTAYQAKKAKDSGAAIEDSVNHRHLQPQGTPRLYDAIIELHQHSHRMDEKTDELLEWKRTYDGGPLDGGAKVTAFVESVDELKLQVQKLEHHCKKKDCSDGCNG